MTNAEVDETAKSDSTEFIHQTGAVVYAEPSSDANIIVRLHEGDPLKILYSQSGTQSGWLAVETVSRQNGFIKANTKLITREQLPAEREKTRRGYTLGLGKMVMGGVICLFGCATIAAPFLFSTKHDQSFVIYYGAAAVGAGEFLWGLEQVVNIRRALKDFDKLWHEALRWNSK